jgi:hypothetical protein
MVTAMCLTRLSMGTPLSFIRPGTRIMRSPTPASEVDEIGWPTAATEASNVRTISLSSAIVADM